MPTYYTISVTTICFKDDSPVWYNLDVALEENVDAICERLEGACDVRTVVAFNALTGEVVRNYSRDR